MEASMEDDSSGRNGGAGIALRLRTSLRQWLRSGLQMRFETAGFTFAQFGEDDADALFEIRNHESVRTFMPSAAPLSYARHREWVDAHLRADSEPPMLVFIGRRDGRAMGFGLLKQHPDAAIELGVMVLGELQGTLVPGRVATALAAIAIDAFGAATLLTYANERHALALRLNRGFGLLEAASDKAGEVCFRTPAATVQATRLYKACGRGLAMHVRGSGKEVE
jgi:hypothetical protein